MKSIGLQMPREVQLDKQSVTATYARFFIEPFERGFGLTVGHALRRILLSSIEGAAVTSIKVKGVLHEFSTLPGMYEDVTEVVLNIKQLRMRKFSDEPATIFIEADKAGEYLAEHITSNGTIEILNPDLHLFTLTEDKPVRIDMVVNNGRGYSSAEENKEPEQPAGVIPLDAMFSPVVRVNYDVEHTRVGQRTDYDKLILEIWTDGTLTPEDALAQAARILRDHLSVFISADDELEVREDKAVDEETLRIRSLLKMRVDELELSVRSANCLQAANIQTIEQLVQKTEADMLKYRNFGRKSLNELNLILSEMGLSFGMDISKYKEEGAE